MVDRAILDPLHRFRRALQWGNHFGLEGNSIASCASGQRAAYKTWSSVEPMNPGRLSKHLISFLALHDLVPSNSGSASDYRGSIFSRGSLCGILGPLHSLNLAVQW